VLYELVLSGADMRPFPARDLGGNLARAQAMAVVPPAALAPSHHFHSFLAGGRAGHDYS